MIINVKPIALLTALLLFLALHASYLMSASLGIVEWCVPYLEGCTSISRASRTQPVVFFFRGTMMSAAVVIFIFVLLQRQWLLSLGAPRDVNMDLLVLFAFLAAAGMLIYCAFLGTGAVFRPYRRFSVITFLGCIIIIQLMISNKLAKLLRQGIGTRALKRIWQGMIAVTVTQLLLGLVNIAVVPFLENNDPIEDAIEWNVVGLMIVFCMLVYAGWRVTGFTGRFSIANEVKAPSP